MLHVTRLELRRSTSKKEHDIELQIRLWTHNATYCNLLKHGWIIMQWRLTVKKQLCRNIPDLCDRLLNVWYYLFSAIYQDL